MSDFPDPLDLTALAEESGVSPRTIRYYVQQGLLPSPGTRGPSTRYDRGHLDRLQLIKRLQRQHLPLAEIRRRLEELDDDGVRLALESLPAEPPRTSALDYVRQVLAGAVGPAEPPEPAAIAPASAAPDAEPEPFESPARARFAPPPPTGALKKEAAETTIVRPAAPRHAPAEPADEPTRGPDPAAWAHSDTHTRRPPRSQWERLTRDPHIELHVRRPLSRDQNRRVEKLLDAARRIFSEEP